MVNKWVDILDKVRYTRYIGYAYLDRKEGYGCGDKNQAEGTYQRSSEICSRVSVEFRDGVCSGYLTYYDQYQGKPLADLDMYTFIAQNIMDVHGTNAFNAGYCTGWIEALLEDRKVLN